MAGHVDTIVFGAGPAGLAATLLLMHEGRRVALVELGSAVTHRGRHVPADLVTGVGGAGLYSDGKFSFYPSASALWQLEDRVALRDAYRWFSDVLTDFTPVPPFPSEAELASPPSYDPEMGKSYESRYIDFDARVELIKRLSRAVKGALTTHAAVVQVTHDDGVLTAVYEQGSKLRSLSARAGVIACGRFGGLMLGTVAPWMPTTFRRFEVGVRLEASSGVFFLQGHPDLDPKFILRSASDVEWRTFCTCRNGEVVETEFDGLVTYSGRSDVGRTRFSNVGFNVRVLREPEPGSELQQELQGVMKGAVAPFTMGIEHFMSSRLPIYGRVLDGLLRQGLTHLLGGNAHDLVVTGPCIEGTGRYPEIDGNLRVQDAPLWVAGDEAGIFRGLTAAFLSGHYAARQVQKYLASIEEAGDERGAALTG